MIKGTFYFPVNFTYKNIFGLAYYKQYFLKVKQYI